MTAGGRRCGLGRRSTGRHTTSVTGVQIGRRAPFGVEQARHPFELPLAVEQEPSLNDDWISRFQAGKYRIKQRGISGVVFRFRQRTKLHFNEFIGAVGSSTKDNLPPPCIEYSLLANREYLVDRRLRFTVRRRDDHVGSRVSSSE